MGFLRLLSRAIDALNELFLKLASWGCVLLVAVTLQQVIARYFFQESSIAAQEAIWHIFGFVFLMAAAATFREDKHVRVDILYSKVSEKNRALINLGGILLLLVPMTLTTLIFGIAFAQDALGFANPHALDHWSQRLSPGFLQSVLSTLEEWLRTTLLVGEISPNPGGLEGRWMVKAAIPLGALLLLLQGISEAVKCVEQLRAR